MAHARVWSDFTPGCGVGVKTVLSSGVDVAGVVGPLPDEMATTWTYNTTNNRLAVEATPTRIFSGWVFGIVVAGPSVHRALPKG